MGAKLDSFLVIPIFIVGGVSAIFLSAHFDLGWIPFVGIYVGVVSGLCFFCFAYSRLALSNGTHTNVTAPPSSSPNPSNPI